MACWHITAQLDHETGEGAGAGGTFQVINLEDDEQKDLTPWWTKACTSTTSTN